MTKKLIWLIIMLLSMLASNMTLAGIQQITLNKLSPSSTITLTCVSDEQGVDIPISDRWIVKKATLTLHYTSSINLQGEVSQLAIKINNFPVAQTRLNPASPDVIVKISLPTKYLEPGYNKLAFSASQHLPLLGSSCEKPCAPDLWTNVNLSDSSVEIEYDEKPVPLSLSSIADFVFDPKAFPEAHVNLIVEDRSTESLTALGIATSGIARRFDYRKVTFEVSTDIRQGMENILVGRAAFANAFLNARGLALGKPEGGHIKIFHLPIETGKVDPNHALLVLTGVQHDQVKLAAETFSNISVGFPGSQEMNAFSFKMPEIQAYGGRGVVHANQNYTFKTLGFPTTTFKGINASGKTINFRLPADFLVRENLAAKLKLHLAYGAGLHPTSALNVNVNGKTVRAIPIADPDGGFFNDYQIDIPTYLFKPGNNVIAFGVELHPPYKECDMSLMGNMFLTIFENSNLYFPDMPHFVEMPKLELFMLNGFPFTRWPDGFESSIFIAETDANTLAATMNLIGMITQKNGHPLLQVKIDTKLPKDLDGDILVIAPPAKIPQSLMKNSPINFGEASQVPYPVIQDWDDKYSIANIKQKSQLGIDRGMIAEFQSPDSGGRSIVLISAEDGNSLLKLSLALLEPEVQGQTQGGIVLVDMGAHNAKPKVINFNAGDTYTTGKSGKSSKFESYLYSNPGIYYSLIALLTLGFAYTLWRALARYRATRKLGRTNGK